MLINLLSYLNNCYSKNNGNESYSVVIKALQRVGGVPKTQNLLMALVSAQILNRITQIVKKKEVFLIIVYILFA